MKILGISLPEFFRSSKPSKMHVPVCKTISHFNWFARYDVSDGKDESHAKITSMSGLQVNV